MEMFMHESGQKEIFCNPSRPIFCFTSVDEIGFKLLKGVTTYEDFVTAREGRPLRPAVIACECSEALLCHLTAGVGENAIGRDSCEIIGTNALSRPWY